MRVALVHDWLFGMRGGERCLDELSRIFPDAEIYTLFYRPRRIAANLNRHRITVSFLSGLPGVERYYRYLLPLLPLALFDLSRRLRQKDYDLVISVSHCVVKNVQPRPGVPHLCYCLTPARYFWDQFDAYFSGNVFRPLINFIIRLLRRWDRGAAVRGTRYVAISRFIQRRILRVLGAKSEVVYPPVRTDWITPRAEGEVGRGFLCVNALVPYKRVELIIDAFNELKEELLIVGDGPELGRLQARARENIKFIRYLESSELAAAYRDTKALVFAAEEDFGIIPLEVQAAGRPVLCYGSGGALETVITEGDSRTGVFFPEPSVGAIVAAVRCFLQEENRFLADSCVKNAERFSVSRFRSEILEEIQQVMNQKVEC